tara:strand:- start:465 stop:845 length:381 start_codon:yes stop_codon:yes gene_type:complete
MSRITLRQLLDHAAEGELGVLGSLETGMGDQEDGHGATGKLSHDQLLTNPDEAERFVADTDLRLAATSAIRRALISDPAEFDPRKYLKPAMDSMKDQCLQKFEAFGTTDQAGRIRARALSDMALAY